MIVDLTYEKHKIPLEFTDGSVVIQIGDTRLLVRAIEVELINYENGFYSPDGWEPPSWSGVQAMDPKEKNLVDEDSEVTEYDGSFYVFITEAIS